MHNQPMAETELYLPLEGLRQIPEDFLSLAQCAKLLQVSEETVRQYTLAEGQNQLPSVRFDKIRIPRQALITFINSRANGGLIFFDPRYMETFWETEVYDQYDVIHEVPPRWALRRIQ